MMRDVLGEEPGAGAVDAPSIYAHWVGYNHTTVVRIREVARVHRRAVSSAGAWVVMVEGLRPAAHQGGSGGLYTK